MNLIDFMQKFDSEEKCYAHLEKVKGIIRCRKCNRDMYKLRGSKVYQCRTYWCNGQQTATYGTIFYRSSTPLQKWFMAIHLICQNKKGISAYQLKREIKVGYKTAFRMLHLIRGLMKDDIPMFEGISEVDETYIGGKRKCTRYNWHKQKSMVMGVVNRDTGKVHAEVGPGPTEATLAPFLLKHVKKESRLMSDEGACYNSMYLYFDHGKVNHSLYERVVGDIHTNTIEGFWSLLKRGIKGIYHWTSKHRLQAYVDEFVWRYNNRKEKELFSLLLDKV